MTFNAFPIFQDLSIKNMSIMMWWVQ